MDCHLVIFYVGAEAYGVDVHAVESIIRVSHVTLVPQAPSFVEGVTNLRGAILPVIDLRRRLGLNPTPLGREARVIVVELAAGRVGLIVDGVAEVRGVPAAVLEPPPALVTRLDSAFVRGVARLDERLVVLLDLSQVLSGDEQSRVHLPV